MGTVENDSVYAYIKDGLHDVVSVYVDASYSFNENLGKHAYAPFASGWSIPDTDGAYPAAYGLALIWDAPEKDSSIAELRTILGFLDTLHSHYPHLLTRERTFRFHCDNQTLMKELNNAKMNEIFARKSYAKYGKDYARLVYYMTQTKMRFHWVKGHSTNQWNSLADSLARKCYRSAMAEETFAGDERKAWIRKNLLDRKMVSLAPGKTLKIEVYEEGKGRHNSLIEAGKAAKGTKMWDDGETLLVGFQNCHKEESMSVGFSYVHPGTGSHGYTVEKSGDASTLSLQIRAIQFALFNYRMAEGVDLSRPLTIKTELNKVAPLFNTLVKGVEPSVKKDDDALRKELDNLKTMITGLKVRVVNEHSQNLNIVRSMAVIAVEDFGKVSYDSEEHKKRINSRLAKIA